MDHCRNFLRPKNPEAANRAALAIGRHLALLRVPPEIGRPFANNPILRELLIPFGDTGYVALYVYDLSADAIVLLAFRRQKEAGY